MCETMFDYMAQQNGSFDEKPFTPADAAILSTIANINLDEQYNNRNQEYISLGTLAQDFLDCCAPETGSDELKLLKLITLIPRYRDIIVSDVVNDIDKDEEKQFGAITFYPQDGLAYVGYSGTGTSVIGYKEDLNMAFMDLIPSQRDAVLYLNRLEEKLPEEVIVGGFSKGGNLAVFASAFAKPQIREKISTVYNHDGPGFSDLILNEPKYQSLKPIIKTYIPSASIVGIILNHDNSFNTIESSASLILQHQPYSWYFEEDDLKVIEELSPTSQVLRRMQKQLLDHMDVEERQETVNAIFDLIGEVEPDDFVNLISSEKNVSDEFRTAWKNLDRKTKRILTRLFRIIARSFYVSLYGHSREAREKYKKEKKRIKKLKKLK